MIICEKKSFSKNQAEKIKKSHTLSRITKKKVRVYLCPNCHAYHLTTTNHHGD